MKKIIIVCMLMAGASIFGCHDSVSNTSVTNDPTTPVTEKAKASLVINASGNSASKVASKSIMKDASDPSILPSVEGISCETIEAAAFAYEPNSTIHSTNYTALSGTNSPVGNWSAYYFMPSTQQRIIKQGDITDVSAWNENPNDLLASGFESNYYAANASFSMDVVALSMTRVCLLTKEGSISPDTGTNYTLYGRLTNIDDRLIDGPSRFYRYPEYRGANFRNKELVSKDLAFNHYNNYNVLEVRDIVVMFVNKDIFTGITRTTILDKVNSNFHWFDNIDRPITTSILDTLMHAGCGEYPNTTKLAHFASSRVFIIIPYTHKKILLGNGIADETTIANPIVSVTFDIENLLSTKSVWDGTAGGLYTDGYEMLEVGVPVYDRFIEVKSDIANGFNPFGMNISVSEK